MTTNGDMIPSRREGQESLEQLFGEVLDLVDKTVAQISDREVENQLRRVLGQSSHGGQARSEQPGPEKPCQDPVRTQQPKPQRSHRDTLGDGMSIAELEQVLAERLALIRGEAYRMEDPPARGSGVA